MSLDLDTISDAGIRQEFHILQQRADAIIGDVRAALGQNRPPIRFEFTDERSFNGSAELKDKVYVISITAAVPLLSLTLFARLFSESALYPDLPSGTERTSAFTTPFVIDPSDFEKRQDWTVELSAQRAFAASCYADIASSFCICHELGHVMAGHAEADGGQRIRELVSKDSRDRSAVAERDQAWECDADALAAGLMMFFVEEMLHHAASDERFASLFLSDPGSEIEETVSAIVIALFAFFVYLDAARLELDRHGAHPPPLVRSFYVKDLLVASAEAKWPVDTHRIGERIDTRLDQMLSAMEASGLINFRSFSENFLDDINVDVRRITDLQKRHRHTAQAWSWVEWQ